MEKKLRQKDINIVKVVLFGPESTGKTTLSRHLARHYNTVWAPEFAREYLQNKWNNERKTCEANDLIPIAIGQMKLENKLAKKADKILICDTDLLETKVYSEEFYGGFVDEKLDKAANENTYDLYLLTYIDTPFEEDDLRDRPQLRLEMFNAFETALKKHNRPYILLKGDKETRLKNATAAIDKIISYKENLHSFSDSLTDIDMHFLHQNSVDFGTSYDY
jgi:NadR type nicotinamide-nucleotide adenylyltransferase